MLGFFLVDIAAAYELVFVTGRVPGDTGQPIFVGNSALATKRIRPDHMILSPALFKCLKFARISAPYLRTSDHCLLGYVLVVPEVVTEC